MNELPFRQIHLDFHTSEQIKEIGTDFDPAAFAAQLKEANVNSITCFAKCHHGLLYYQSKKYPEIVHPGLKFDLLAAQIKACHAEGIQVSAYISIGFDEYMARKHPEWVEVNLEGRRVGAAPLQAGWRKLCLNTPYIDYVEAQTLEVLDLFPEIGGIFYDIIHQRQCLCPKCLEGMLAAGLDPEVEADRLAFANQVCTRLTQRLSAAIRQRNPQYRIFYNAGHIEPATRPRLKEYSHLELESLPSGGWGYEHFPITARFGRNLGYDFLGMTGKFHKSWADFGSIKNQAALEYECFTNLSLGGKCSIGDQLHPKGRLDEATYDLIGQIYASVAAKEPWCSGVQPVTEIAIFTPEGVGQADGRVDSALAGAYRMLEEAHYQFDVVDGVSDWQHYRVIILPDKITLNPELQAKVAAYLQHGGKILATYKSGLNPAETAFALADWGVEYRGKAPFKQEFVAPRETVAEGIPAIEHIIYEEGLAVTPHAGTQVLADIWEPYFDRTYRHFCSHFQTPAEKKSGRPGLCQKGQVVYGAYPFFGLYKRHGSRTYKQLIVNALRLLLPDSQRLVQVVAPTTAHVTLNHQPEANRYVMHILHYIPERRANNIDIIEDVIPLYNVQVGVKLPARPQRVYLAPQIQQLPFTWEDGRARMVIPQVLGHSMVVCEF